MRLFFIIFIFFSYVSHAETRAPLRSVLKTDNTKGNLTFSRCQVEKYEAFDENKVRNCKVAASISADQIDEIATRFSRVCGGLYDHNSDQNASVIGLATFAIVMTPSLVNALTISSTKMSISMAYKLFRAPIIYAAIAGVTAAVGYYSWEHLTDENNCKTAIAAFLRSRYNHIVRDLPDDYVQYQTMPGGAWELIRN